MYRYSATRLGAALGACALAAAAWAPPAAAAEFDSGDARIGLDTTISHGISWRLKDPQVRPERLNSDDGDLNYERGIVSNTSRFTSELDVEFGNIGAFARVQGFVDFENRGGDGAHKPLPGEAQDRIGDDIEVLDLYASGAFDAGGMPIDARLGYQVLNWGESTFIQGGVNVVNPLDAARLRKPGAELREGLLPVPMISVAAAPTDELSVEAFYQLKWAETRVDPSGTYFAANDYATPGGTRAFLWNRGSLRLVKITDKGGGLGGAPGEALLPAINLGLAGFNVFEPMAAPMPLTNCRLTSAAPTVAGPGCQGGFDPHFMSVSRGLEYERDPSNSGQWGVAVRYYSEALNDTEFGFFFVNHHSRLPLVSAIYGSQTGLDEAVAAYTGVAGTPNALYAATRGAVEPLVEPEVRAKVEAGARAQFAADRLPPGTPDAVIDEQFRAARAHPVFGPQIQQGIDKTVQEELSAFVKRTIDDPPEAAKPSIDGARAALQGAAELIATDRYGRTARYFVEYPEDLQVFGFSFNTLLGTTGWALQGEYSYHPDTPLQRDDAAMFTAGLAPLFGTLRVRAQLRALAAQCAANPRAPDCAGIGPMQQALAGFQNLLETELTGYVQRDVSQMQATATKVIGPVFGADGAVFIAEAALSRVHDMPDREAWPLETFAAGDDPADDTSWGYRAAGRLDYNNAIGAVRLSPYAQFQHDVSGNSPGPSGQFVEGRTALTLGLGVGYLDSIRADLSYTMYGGTYNYLADRDFVALSASYSF